MLLNPDPHLQWTESTCDHESCSSVKLRVNTKQKATIPYELVAKETNNSVITFIGNELTSVSFKSSSLKIFIS